MGNKKWGFCCLLPKRADTLPCMRGAGMYTCRGWLRGMGHAYGQTGMTSSRCFGFFCLCQCRLTLSHARLGSTSLSPPRSCGCGINSAGSKGVKERHARTVLRDPHMHSGAANATSTQHTCPSANAAVPVTAPVVSVSHSRSDGLFAATCTRKNDGQSTVPSSMRTALRSGRMMAGVGGSLAGRFVLRVLSSTAENT